MQVGSGVIVGGKYQLERPLARGGMGAVWVARHVKLGSFVAVKFLDAHLAASPALLARFEREARSAANLDTPHVVHVHDYGVEEGMPYLVMELLRGEGLNTRLRARSRLSLPEAAKILTQMARALRRAHEAGIIHRDLKPANVFLARVDEDEIVKVLDFGIAKETWSRVEESTKTGEIFGSPHYMSPEQARAQKDVDHRADLWATGVLAYRMITGRLPFPGEVLGEVLSSVLVDPVPPIAEVAPDLPPALDGFFAKALAKKKEQRFGSVGELADAFNAIVATALPPPAPQPASRSREPNTTAPTIDPAPAPRPAGIPPVPGRDHGAAGQTTAVFAPPAPPARTAAPPPPHRPLREARPQRPVADTGTVTVPLLAAGRPPQQAFSPFAPPPPAEGTAPSIASSTSSLLPVALTPRRPPILWVTIALGAAAALIVGLTAFGGGSGGSAPAASPEPGATGSTAAHEPATAVPPATPALSAASADPAASATAPPPAASASATATVTAPAAAPKPGSPAKTTSGGAAPRPPAAPSATAGKKPRDWGL